jgi:hypothetical protein
MGREPAKPVAGESGMKCESVGWRCVEAAAGLLAPLEREVILGDLAEKDRGTWRELGDVLGLAARRQLAQWRTWRPWAASVGLTLPASLFLMGCSVAASAAIADLFGETVSEHLLWLSLSRLFLVVCWAWMAGFVVGSVSRDTLWASTLACFAPCLHCLSLWPGHGLSAVRLLIFLIPGLWGVWRGRRNSQLGPGWAVFLAAVAMLTPVMWSRGGWVYGCWLLWPGLYLTATARWQQA